MYHVFVNIPMEVRQAAFDLLVKNGYATAPPRQEGERAARLNRTFVELLTGIDSYANHGYECCPLGAVNAVLGVAQKQLMFIGGQYYTRGCILMPTDGTVAKFILLSKGYPVNAYDAERFIKDNDTGKFTTLEELATAMGVKYTPGAENHVSRVS